MTLSNALMLSIKDRAEAAIRTALALNEVYARAGDDPMTDRFKFAHLAYTEAGKRLAETATPEVVLAMAARILQCEAALKTISGFGSVNLAGEWEHGLRDIIRSITDCARMALSDGEQT